jgi:hypothetical protein
MRKMRLAILTVIVLISAASGAQAVNNPGLAKPGSGMSGAKCEAAWTAVSPNGATISHDKLAPYTGNFTSLDTDNDGTLDANEFMAGCKDGLIK